MKPELVVPAGDFDALRAAVCNGADAVYLGGKRFNARIHAKNFGLDELGQVVRYAHNRNVKVYVTVNTLVADRELCDLDDYLTNLHSLEADAVIVQDLGVLKLCRELHPDLRVHASTQATISSSAGAKLWAEHGAKRAILARELSLEQIRKIKSNYGVEIEVFAHGALCFSYSGQCLLSGFIGGRSANRGRCASPCRLPYSIVTGNGVVLRTDGHHLLSMKDLNLSEDIGKLASVGVDALKIEGRMKIPEYVAVVTGTYRKILDGDYCEPTLAEKRDLEAIFSREFTKGCFYSYPGSEAINRERPGNYGVEVGVVTGYNASSKTVSILLSEDTRVGDGLEFQTASGREGLIIKKMLVNGRSCSEACAKTVAEIVLPFQPLPNSQVRKSRDSDLHERARATFSYPDRLAAIKPSGLHSSKQSGYERLSSILLAPKKKEKEEERTCSAPKICAEVTTLQTLKEAINAGADEIYFGGFPEAAQQLDLNNYRQALDTARESNVPLTVVLPRVTGSDECLKDWMLKLREAGADTFLVGDIVSLEVAREVGVKTYVDSSLNLFNRLTRNLLFDYADRITLSQELHLSQISRISGGAPGEIECIVHGPLTLMLSRYCPASNAVNRGDKISCRETCSKKGFLLKDQNNEHAYTLKCDEVSNTHIISSNDICLIEHLPELKAAGIDVLRIRCHLYSPSLVAELVKAYKTALSTDKNQVGAVTLSNLKERIRALSERGLSEGKLMTGVE